MCRSASRTGVVYSSRFGELAALARPAVPQFQSSMTVSITVSPRASGVKAPLVVPPALANIGTSKVDGFGQSAYGVGFELLQTWLTIVPLATTWPTPVATAADSTTVWAS